VVVVGGSGFALAGVATKGEPVDLGQYRVGGCTESSGPLMDSGRRPDDIHLNAA
jgi:hypothetical protein